MQTNEQWRITIVLRIMMELKLIKYTTWIKVWEEVYGF